jgi:DNA-binding transcriptional ArsR family regulator
MGAAASLHMIGDLKRAAAMLHPLRLRILSELEAADSAAGLAKRLGMPRQKLNYHIRQLEKQGLVEEVGVRAVARSYLISPTALGPLAADPERVRDRTSSSYLVAVAARVIAEVADLRERARKSRKKLPTLTLQAEVRFASPESQHAFAAELSREVSRIVAKYHDEAAPSGRRFRLVAGAYPVPLGLEESNTDLEKLK